MIHDGEGEGGTGHRGNGYGQGPYTDRGNGDGYTSYSNGDGYGCGYLPSVPRSDIPEVAQ